MRVLIINQHSSNFGDDAAGCALVQMLLNKASVTDIDIIYNANKLIPIRDKRLHHHIDINFSSAGHFNALLYIISNALHIKTKGIGVIMKKWAEIISKADVVFVAPCGANIGIYKDWSFLARVLMVVLAEKKPVFHYNTIGSSGNKLFDIIAKFILKRSTIYVREKKSQDYLNSLGIKSEFGPDTAFALKSILKTKHERIVSLIPSSFDRWHPSFIKKPIDKKIQRILIPQIAEWANNNDMNIHILPHLMLPEETKYNEIIKSILNNNGCKNVVIRNDIKTMWEYDKTISESDIVIGMRYHSIVLAAKNYRPFIALSYENKMIEMCDYTHMSKYVIDLNRITDDEIGNLKNKLNSISIEQEEIFYHLKKTIEDEIRPQINVPVNRFCSNV